MHAIRVLYNIVIRGCERKVRVRNLCDQVHGDGQECCYVLLYSIVDR